MSNAAKKGHTAQSIPAAVADEFKGNLATCIKYLKEGVPFVVELVGVGRDTIHNMREWEAWTTKLGANSVEI